MSFSFTPEHLVRILDINQFTHPADALVFFGFRGCRPVDPKDHSFATNHEVECVDINHINPRCVIGQWRPQQGELAVFPGSTVPHTSYIKTSLVHHGAGANQLMTGYYQDFRKGNHRIGAPGEHEAFRQTGGRAIRRTVDDADYDTDDIVEFSNPQDNLHAAWSMGVDSDSFASAGCQVVVGYPKCPKRDTKPNTGPWKDFHHNAYNIAQTRFSYILVTGTELQSISAQHGALVPAKLRFGSTGGLVEELQQALARKGYYEGKFDGDFGPRTATAVLSFQESEFGRGAADGIVSQITADALAIQWPHV